MGRTVSHRRVGPEMLKRGSWAFLTHLWTVVGPLFEREIDLLRFRGADRKGQAGDQEVRRSGRSSKLSQAICDMSCRMTG